MAEKNTNIATFKKVWKENKHESMVQGRPVGEYVDYIEIRGLGQDKQVVIRKVQPKDLIEYERQWSLYQRGLEQQQEGTPLEQWSYLVPGDVLRLKSNNVHTIEACAALSDAGCHNIGAGAIELRKRAQYYLEHDAPKAAHANARAEADELRLKVQELERENLQLRQMLAEAYEGVETADAAEGVEGSKKRKLSAAQQAVLARGRARRKAKLEAKKAKAA